MQKILNTSKVLTPVIKGLANTAAKLVFITAVATYATTNLASTPATDHKPTFVDSIHQWGAWELDIEPAAGGLQPSSNQAFNARGPRVDLYAISTSVISTRKPSSRGIPAIPATPATPAIPAVPGVTPAVPARPARPASPALPGSTPPIIVTLP